MTLKTKNTRRRRSRLERRIGAGVFLLAVAMVWFMGWKLFRGVQGVSVSGPGENQSNIVQTSQPTDAPFSDPSRYPIAVMIDNSPEARPHHAGMSEAAVVYEALVEGGATRFMALFSGAPDVERVGPIRSARPYFVETVAGWSGFYWHGGGSPEGLALIPKTDITDLNEISGLGVLYFWRDNDISRPHNLFTSGNLMSLGLDDFDLTSLPEEKLQWQWNLDPEIDGDPAKHIYIDFSEGVLFDASFDYDPDTKTYMRSMGGMVHNDANTGEQLAPRSIIVQHVPAEGYYPSGYGRIIIDMAGEGDATLFANGVARDIRWKKKDVNSQTEWLDSEGSSVVLPIGQVWVDILPGDRVASYE